MHQYGIAVLRSAEFTLVGVGDKDTCVQNRLWSTRLDAVGKIVRPSTRSRMAALQHGAKAMKCVKKIEGNKVVSIQRVSELEAKDLVRRGWAYASKFEWRAFRKAVGHDD